MVYDSSSFESVPTQNYSKCTVYGYSYWFIILNQWNSVSCGVLEHITFETTSIK